MNTTPVSLLRRLHQPAPEAAWAQFVELYTPILYAWTRRLGLRPEDRADLVQEVFTVLVEKLPDFKYDRQKSFRGWLHTILLNKWRNRLRRPPAASLDAHDGRLEELAGAPDPLPLEEAEYRQQVVSRALQLMQVEFEPSTWKACWEFVVSGRPAAEVAAELGISVNAVYLAKGRVLRRLREELEGLLD
jgi:RNA polymerase sigma-70 factor (ECF subfamily)